MGCGCCLFLGLSENGGFPRGEGGGSSKPFRFPLRYLLFNCRGLICRGEDINGGGFIADVFFMRTGLNFHEETQCLAESDIQQ